MCHGWHISNVSNRAFTGVTRDTLYRRQKPSASADRRTTASRLTAERFAWRSSQEKQNGRLPTPTGLPQSKAIPNEARDIPDAQTSYHVLPMPPDHTFASRRHDDHRR
jgi:hypothetical protein